MRKSVQLTTKINKGFIAKLTFIFLFSITYISPIHSDGNPTTEPLPDIRPVSEQLFSKISCQELSYPAFQAAMEAHKVLLSKRTLKNDSILTIVDFSKPSNEKRFFVIDVKNKKILHKELVAHGKNTGMLFAKNFSNIAQSLQSSLGMYLTAETYHGKHGYSLRLDGVVKGLNDKARQRAIVIHGANYVSESFAKIHGRIGRSFGCPALSYEVSTPIINTIKNQSCLFLYHPELNQNKLLATI
ncbi:MAG: murein L,D-transpeptidase catalytic domain family protein [Marinilabiliaceae bacterium]|nr:murein L,D-transpeptidase catalytic domain family protein [Marinilabiliaceae bacterium]